MRRGPLCAGCQTGVVTCAGGRVLSFREWDEARLVTVALERYSIRRQTYACQMACRVIRDHLGELDAGTRAIVAKDVRAELDMDARCADLEFWEPLDPCWSELADEIEGMVAYGGRYEDAR